MIFVTVGHKEFDRLIERMDSVAKDIGREVVMQIGWKPRYLPENAKYFHFLTRKEIDKYFQQAELIIGHCSIGILLRAELSHKPLIIVPRMYSLREVVSSDVAADQVELVRMLIERENVQGVRCVLDIRDLDDRIEEMLGTKEAFVMKTSDHTHRLINTIYSFVANLRNDR